MGDLFVDVFDGNSWINIDRINGQTHTSASDPWSTRIINLSNYANRIVKFRFRGTKGISFTGDMAIDDVRVLDLPPNYVSISKISIDSVHCGQSYPSSVMIEFENFSNSLISKDSVTLDLYLNGQIQASEKPASDLLASTTTLNTHHFNYHPFISNSGTNNFMVVLKVQNGATITADTIYEQVENNIEFLPYFQGFENSYVECWNHFNQTFAPNFSEIDGWHILPDTFNSWHVTDTTQCYYQASWGATTGNTGPYGPQEGTAFLYWAKNHTSTSYLYSPCFDFSRYSQLELEYWYHQYALNPSFMGKVKLELDSMGTWV